MELIIRLELRERNRIYTPQEKYITCGAQLPGTPSPISILEAPFPTLQVIYHQLHPNVVPSSRPQNRGEPREEEQKTVSRRDAQGAENGQKPPPPEPPFLVGCLFTSTDDGSGASQRNFMQADVLDGRPNYGQATGFCGEHVNLIGTLPHIAEQTQSAHW